MYLIGMCVDLYVDVTYVFISSYPDCPGLTAETWAVFKGHQLLFVWMNPPFSEASGAYDLPMEVYFVSQIEWRREAQAEGDQLL